jgi:hypothetical protein
MNENKQQPQALDEDQLFDVAGGFAARNCFFEPEMPIKRRVEGGKVRVKCKSWCHSPHPVVRITCMCNGQARCIDQWHEVEQANPGIADGNWFAAPRDSFNHDEGRKIIRGLFI